MYEDDPQDRVLTCWRGGFSARTRWDGGDRRQESRRVRHSRPAAASTRAVTSPEHRHLAAGRSSTTAVQMTADAHARSPARMTTLPALSAPPLRGGALPAERHEQYTCASRAWPGARRRAAASPARARRVAENLPLAVQEIREPRGLPTPCFPSRTCSRPARWHLPARVQKPVPAIAVSARARTLRRDPATPEESTARANLKGRVVLSIGVDRRAHDLSARRAERAPDP